jgi:hypothetical protein
VSREEARERRGHVRAAERARCRHREAAHRRRALGEHLSLCLVDLGEDPSCAEEVALPRVRQRHRARRALEEAHAEALLERADRARHGGGREPELARRADEAPLLGDRHERVHGVEAIHRTIVPPFLRPTQW